MGALEEGFQSDSSVSPGLCRLQQMGGRDRISAVQVREDTA